jgi:hypothetical protein
MYSSRFAGEGLGMRVVHLVAVGGRAKDRMEGKEHIARALKVSSEFVKRRACWKASVAYQQNKGAEAPLLKTSFVY